MIRARERFRHDAIRANLDLPDFFEDFPWYHALAKCFVAGKLNFMSATQVLEQIHKLPFEEQYEVFEHLRGEFDPELTPEQIAELDRRAEELRQHPERGVPWETVQAELHERLKSRKA
jgi:putative addiction module component (TIGR02574 family)